MWRFGIVATILFLILGTIAMWSKSSNKVGEYYSGFSPIENVGRLFPDFVLFYRGRKPGGFYPGRKDFRLGEVLTFEAIQGQERVVIYWSSGTGEIGPSSFEIGGKSFLLAPYLPPGFSDRAFRVPQIMRLIRERFYCYPAVTDDSLALNTPALFIEKMESLQEKISKNGLNYGKLQIHSEIHRERFEITSYRWAGANLEESMTYSYPIQRGHWSLPIGYYRVRGIEPDSSDSYFEIRRASVTRVNLSEDEDKDDDPFGRKSRAERKDKKRVQGKLGQEAAIGKQWVTEFPGGLSVALHRARNQLISHWVCLELDEGVNGAPCATVPTEQFRSPSNSKSNILNYETHGQRFVVKIVAVESSDRVRIVVTKK